MFRDGIPIGKAFGISLKLHYSWFIIFILITWALVVSYYPAAYPEWDLTARLIVGIITSLLFFGSVLAHELMHSLVAKSEGIPVKSITLFILGGVSEITEEPKKPQDEFRMAFAGPLTSIVLGVIFWAIGTFWTASPDYIKGVAIYLGLINLILGAFNLIPGFPLDGGRVLRSLIWWKTNNVKKATMVASRIGQAIGYLFILGGIFLAISSGDFFSGIWLALIGWFLQSSAAGSYRQLALQDMLKGHTAAEVMTTDCNLVPRSISVDRLVTENILAQSKRCFPVVDGTKAIGLVTLHNVRQLPRDQWASRTVGEIMTPLEKMKMVAPETELTAVLNILTEDNINQIPVIKDGNVVGIVTRENILNYINLRGELGG